MQDRGVYKEECSMKKVCAALFLIILLLRPLCQSAPLGRCGDVRAAGGDFERTAGADAVVARRSSARNADF